MPDENKALYAGAPEAEISPGVQEMIDAGVFYGRAKSKTHPKMKQFVLANRGGVQIIDLEKTAEHLEKATAFVKEKTRHGAYFLFVGTQPHAQSALQAAAASFNWPFVNNRWVGGTLTNFKNISLRVDFLKKLRQDFASGALEKYTKKERLMIEREKDRLSELLGGLETLTRMPDLMVVIDAHVHHAAMREARRMGIPVVAFSDLDTDPSGLPHLVPGNSKSRKSVEWFLGKVKAAAEEGRKMAAVEAPVSPEIKRAEATKADAPKASPEAKKNHSVV